MSLVYLLGQFWAPMMVYSVVSGLAYIILFRTLYCILRLETRSREVGNHRFEEIALIRDIPSSILFYFIFIIFIMLVIISFFSLCL